VTAVELSTRIAGQVPPIAAEETLHLRGAAFKCFGIVECLAFFGPVRVFQHQLEPVTVERLADFVVNLASFAAVSPKHLKLSIGRLFGWLQPSVPMWAQRRQTAEKTH